MNPMRVLVVHNRYTQRGGEDVVVEHEVAALRERGHHVELVQVDNAEPAATGGRTKVASRAIWNREAAQRIASVARAFKPDVAHVHNHAYELSASIFPALREAGVPVVATLHNYRMTCSATYLLRDGRPCELCVGKRASWQGIRHKCFRGSRSGSAMVAGMQLAYRRSAIPNIDRWIALTNFARSIYERADFPADRLVVRPNTIRDPGAQSAHRAPDAPIIFVGRLEPSKGVDTLIQAWGSGIGAAQLLVVGDGPLRSQLQQLAPASVGFLGAVPLARVEQLLRSARALVVPSTWYEGFPMVVLEAFAVGTPVIASDLGSLAEIVPQPDVGWRVPARYVDGLRAAMAAALDDPRDAELRGARARRLFEQRYSQQIVMAQLEGIYRDVIAGAR